MSFDSAMPSFSLILLPMVIGATVTNGGIYFARRLTGHKMKTIISVSADVCHRECRLRADCLSLNYNRHYTMCELNNYATDGTQNQDFTEEKGWIYLNVEREVYTDLGVCNVNMCPDGTVCRNGNCVTERCVPTENISVASGIVYGNMNDIGSKIWIVCNAEDHLIEADVSECLVDGSWSSLPTCEKICPVPLELQNVGGYPTIVSANIHTPNGLLTNINLINADTIAREDSEVMFACAGGTYLQSHQRIFCHDGQWIYMPGCQEMGLGIDCVVNVICSVLSHSNECVNRICRCPLGTSYSYSESRCIEKCPSGYADTFNEVKGVGQWNDYNIESFSGTRAECEAECISRVSYTCRSFDHNIKTSACYLQEVTYFDDPPSVYGWSGGAYFLRDCL